MLTDALPSCGFENCWSRDNPDRAYGDEGIRCTANGDDAMDPSWTRMGGDSEEFWACEVCLSNASIQQWRACAGCGITMITYGIVLAGGEFCVHCMPMATIEGVAERHGLDLGCVEWGEIAYASHGERWADSDKHQTVVALLTRGEQGDLVRPLDAARDAAASDEVERKRRRVERMVSLFPGLSPEEAADIDDGQDMDESTTVYSFLKRMRE